MTFSDLSGLELEFLRVAYMFFPLLGSGVFVGLFIRFDWAAFLSGPVDGGMTWRGRRLFGDHKTLRGFLAAAIGTALFFSFQTEVLHQLPALRALEYFDYSAIQPWFWGLVLGFAGMLSELPNSFLKRQLGIAPGRGGTGPSWPVFVLLDQIDSLLGAWVVFAQLTDVNFRLVFISLILFGFMHPVVSLIGRAVGLKRWV